MATPIALYIFPQMYQSTLTQLECILIGMEAPFQVIERKKWHFVKMASFVEKKGISSPDHYLEVYPLLWQTSYTCGIVCCSRVTKR